MDQSKVNNLIGQSSLVNSNTIMNVNNMNAINSHQMMGTNPQLANQQQQHFNQNSSNLNDILDPTDYHQILKIFEKYNLKVNSNRHNSICYHYTLF